MAGRKRFLPTNYIRRATASIMTHSKQTQETTNLVSVFY